MGQARAVQGGVDQAAVAHVRAGQVRAVQVRVGQVAVLEVSLRKRVCVCGGGGVGFRVLRVSRSRACVLVRDGGRWALSPPMGRCGGARSRAVWRGRGAECGAGVKWGAGHQPAYTLDTSLPIPWAPACLYPGHQPVYTLKGFRVLTPSLACPPRNPCLPCYTPPHCTRMGVTQAPTRPSAWMAYPTAAPDHQPWPVGRGTPRPPPRPHAPPSGMCRRRRRGMQMPTKCWPGQRAEGENNNWLWSKQLLLFYFKFSFPSACSLPVGGMLFGVSGLLFFFLLSNCFKVSCYCY